MQIGAAFRNSSINQRECLMSIFTSPFDYKFRKCPRNVTDLASLSLSPVQTVPAFWMWSPSSSFRRRCCIRWSCSWSSTTQTLCNCLPSCSRKWPTCDRSSPTTSTSSSCWRKLRWTCAYTHCCRRSWRTCIRICWCEKKGQVDKSGKEKWKRLYFFKIMSCEMKRWSSHAAGVL